MTASRLRAAADHLRDPGADPAMSARLRLSLADWLDAAATDSDTTGTDGWAVTVADALLGEPDE